jgi:alcohol-forming fatty acyl-CoA reductase
LWKKLDKRDKEIFYFDMEEINWKDFLYSNMVGLRMYLMKEDPSTIPEAKRRLAK